MAALTPAGREIRRFVEEFGLVVRRGPFAGMEYVRGSQARVSFLAAKLLGSYELELHGVIDSLLSQNPRQIIDVGAADGYYAVGLACRAPSAQIIAFDTDMTGRRMCAKLATRNGVRGQLDLRGHCGPRELAEVTASGAWVLCDCEGFEFDLIRPDRVPGLRSAMMLIELHPYAHPDIVRVMFERFAGTHDVHIISQQERKRCRWPELEGRSPEAAFLLLSEGPPHPDRAEAFRRCWAHMVPR